MDKLNEYIDRVREMNKDKQYFLIKDWRFSKCSQSEVPTILELALFLMERESH